VKSLASKIELDEVDSLWQQLREGNRNGLEGLYRHFAKALFQYGLAMVPDEDFVQDCIQEVFIDLWKYHKNLQTADNVRLYLFRSLSHKIFREDKKEKKWKKETLKMEVESFFFVDSKEADLIGTQTEEFLQRKLAGALQELPLRQKEVVQYLFFESFSYEEVSKLMVINLRSVYSLAWKAISYLTRVMLLVLLLIKCYQQVAI